MDESASGILRAVAERAMTLAMLALMFQPFRRMLDFRGRARRSEFALFLALQLALMVAVLGVAMLLTGIGDAVEVMVCYLFGHMAVFALPMIALQVRRMHDSDRSGWWVAVSLLPYIGTGMILYFMAQSGTWGENRFGPDPRQRWDGDLFE